MTYQDSPPSHSEATSRAAKPIIETVSEIQRDYIARQSTRAERLGDLIGGFAGSLRFVALELILVGGWIIVNLGLIPGVSPFDRFPFGLLQLVLSGESILLLIFVLMRENLRRRQSEHRDQLDLQVNLLADRKATEALRVLLRLSEHLGVEDEEAQEAEHLSRALHIETLERELEKHLPK